MTNTTTAKRSTLPALSLNAARGVSALCDAISYLGRVRDEHGCSDMRDCMRHLVHAATELPDEIFQCMLVSRQVGLDEVCSRLANVIREEVAA